MEIVDDGGTEPGELAVDPTHFALHLVAELCVRRQTLAARRGQLHHHDLLGI